MAELLGRSLHIKGIVQGVGFRPLIYNYAHDFNLTGWIRNSSNGVEIEIYGSNESISGFINKIKTSPPVRARIDTFDQKNIPYKQVSTFSIRESSKSNTDFIPISPDLAVCSDCLQELFDPQNRRYRYPYINCVNCGPRFTIIKSIPYDRPRTTMSDFVMCSDCQAEYDDPSNRRFHAQPIACPRCGPDTQFIIKGEVVSTAENAIQQARQLLTEGGIVAVKSLGGYQLACDATNLNAIFRLRERKKRIQKPFALMACDISVIKNICEVDNSESDLLRSTQSPIVVLRRKSNSILPLELAPNQTTLGFMLPYTPLHYLLLEPDASFPQVLVMTSGNISEEPIAYRDDDSIDILKDLADGYLTHSRPIHMRTDDSVVKVFRGIEYPIRRARGYAPNPIQIPEIPSQIFAAGSDLKNAFCFTRANYAFISHHIGDLENFETFKSYESAYDHFQELFKITPQIIACDQHPEYFSSKYAQELAMKNNLPVYNVQHHHAHLASCLIDNSYFDGPVIGLIFDGTGYGLDGNIWGGEIMVGDLDKFERLYHLEYYRLPGGDGAIYHVARTGFAYLLQSKVEENEIYNRHPLSTFEQEIVKKQLSQGLNSPFTSSMGRLFDAVSSILGVCNNATYEGQAAIELEMIADRSEKGFYSVGFNDGNIKIGSLIKAIADDLRDGISASRISMKFHNSLVKLVASICEEIGENNQIRVVALSGGVWQNLLLLEKTYDTLARKGFLVLHHRQIPTNDAGLALGQALIAYNKNKRG